MISEFQGQYRFLSNFWPAVVQLDGVYYPSVEHAYQASKSNQASWRLYIGEADSPGLAKRRAREIPKEYQNSDWMSMRQEIMFDLLKQKFASGKLRDQLLATGDEELVEGNTWGDTFWGMCNGKGENHLGRMLMKIRASFVDFD
jgi:ribA/ribD-fused uncharacterized protein